MTRAAGRLAAAQLLAAAAVLLPASAAVPAPLAAADAPNCVGVLVDATRLGGTVRTGCVDGDPSSGLDALRRAGFTYTPRPRDGLVCQVDGVPACTDTTTSAYWSYWWRAPGSARWTYGHEGAATHDPPPGSTEAWVWQDGGRAEPPDVALTTICPQAAGAPSSKPTTTARRAGKTTKPADPGRRATRPAEGRKSDAAEQPEAASARATTSAPTATSAAATPSSTAAADRPTVDDAPTDDAVAAQVAGGGTPPWLGLAAGAAVVAALGGAALWRFRTGSP